VQALLPLGVDIIITDDGLQHYALQRDIELVVVDGERRFGNQSLIPLGPLRESVERLNEVDFIITNGGKAHDGEAAMSLSPSFAVNLKNRQQVPVSQLTNLVAMAGIGHPPRFFNTLETLGAKLNYAQGFADHKDFIPAELEALSKRGEHLIMTEKDAVKCADYAKENWWYLPVTASFNQQDEQRILNKIKEVKEKYGSPSA
jgi:tetraacyldisaccharide 4'-kinase